MNLLEYKNCLNSLNQIDLDRFKDIVTQSRHIVLLGNGGSNAITCHIAQDYTKALKKKAICFGDSSRLTCYANDYGWDMAYAKFLEEFCEPDSLVILISSSGNSQNILNCAQYCEDNKLNMVTLSGFYSDNKLRTQYNDSSLVHFYVESLDYGVVECLHELILHSVI